MSHIVIISGGPGAGKSSVAESLCERYDRTVHLKTDELYASIRMGFISPWKPESDRQNRMISRATARAATAFAQELYAVFIDGVIGPHLLPEYLEELRPAGVPVHFVILRPSIDEIVRRGTTREGADVVPEAMRVPEPLLRRGHETFEKWGDFAGLTIDSSALTADQTADRVMDACGAGECLVLSPEG
jgi:chloramphenicol 3-O-phosphotransferase